MTWLRDNKGTSKIEAISLIEMYHAFEVELYKRYGQPR